MGSQQCRSWRRADLRRKKGGEAIVINGQPAFDRIVDQLRQLNRKVTPRGPDRVSASCPGPLHKNGDRNPSLSVARGDGLALINCRVGCDTRDVMGSLGLPMSDLFDNQRGMSWTLQDGRREEKYYSRGGEKKFTQRGIKNPTTVLYTGRGENLDKVTKAMAEGKTIFLVEGLKDVDTIRRYFPAEVAASAPQGANSFHLADAAPLHGAQIIAIVDNDDAGERIWVPQVIEKLTGIVASLDFVKCKIDTDGADVSDHIAAGYSLDELLPWWPDPYASVKVRYPRLDIAALLDPNRPEREYVVRGLIPAGASCALVAPAGTGKSMLLLAISLAVARGDRSFAGLSITTRKVLLIDMENTEDDLSERFRDLGVRLEDIARLDKLIFIHLPVLAPLDTIGGGIEMEKIIDAYDVQKGDAVVFDSFQRVLEGPEDKSDTIRAYYMCTGMMLKRRGITVIRTDNTGHQEQGRARGSSGKRDDVDVELVMERTSESDIFTLKPGKIRLPSIETVRIERFYDEDGHIYYDAGRDPFRVQVNHLITEMDKLGIDDTWGEKKVIPELEKAMGSKPVLRVLRVAIPERRALLKSARDRAR
jgi:KaiC/GvpD/RAD55 family RecA-like ATPase/5S rRNA maturation endonuclease (ribonuclease M5)